MRITYSSTFLKQFLTIFFPPWDENCAFIMGTYMQGEYLPLQLQPTPNITPHDPALYYAIGASAWRNAKKDARREGIRVIGHAHTHVNGTADPSPMDLRYIRKGEIGAIFHVRSSSITWYTRQGVIQRDTIEMPLWMRALSWIFCT